MTRVSANSRVNGSNDRRRVNVRIRRIRIILLLPVERRLRFFPREQLFSDGGKPSHGRLKADRIRGDDENQLRFPSILATSTTQIVIFFRAVDIYRPNLSNSITIPLCYAAILKKESIVPLRRLIII